eukprot:5105_1
MPAATEHPDLFQLAHLEEIIITHGGVSLERQRLILPTIDNQIGNYPNHYFERLRVMDLDLSLDQASIIALATFNYPSLTKARLIIEPDVTSEYVRRLFHRFLTISDLVIEMDGTIVPQTLGDMDLMPNITKLGLGYRVRMVGALGDEDDQIQYLESRFYNLTCLGLGYNHAGKQFNVDYNSFASLTEMNLPNLKKLSIQIGDREAANIPPVPESSVYAQRFPNLTAFRISDMSDEISRIFYSRTRDRYLPHVMSFVTKLPNLRTICCNKRNVKEFIPDGMKYMTTERVSPWFLN